MPVAVMPAAYNPAFAWGAAGVAAAAVAFLPAFWLAAVPLLAVAVAFAEAAVLRVRISPAGLEAVATAGWPRIRLPLDRIATARAITVRPTRFWHSTDASASHRPALYSQLARHAHST